MTKYYWQDGFDGGEESEYFDSVDEAKTAALDHISSIRLTAAELERLCKESQNYVYINAIKFDDVDDERGEEFGEIDVFNINEETLGRLY